MTQPTWQIVVLIESAREVCRVRISAGAADLVAAHAKHLARPSMAACAADRVEPGGTSVRIRRARRAGPARWMWIAAGRVDSGDSLARMAVDAEQLAMTDHAHAGLGRCLLVVDREEIRSVHRLAHRRVKSQSRGDSRGRHAMTGRTLTLSVTSRAEVALRVGLHSVFAQKVAVVDHVALWRDSLGRELDVTAIAVAHVPLPRVLVTAEARRHVGTKGGILVLHVHVAANAISRALLKVVGMGEAQVLACHLGRVPCPLSPMALRARVGVVRVFVTLDAASCRREVERVGLARVLDARVTLETVDALEHVRSMLEGSLRLLALAL